MDKSLTPRPVVLCILDGWGQRPDSENNAIAEAATPVFDRLSASCPNALLKTSGTEVGLPHGQMGNSEVGHLNLGAGRIVDQDIRRVDAAIEDGTLAGNPALCALIDRLRDSGGVCHLMGLLSPGGVHSHQDHMTALAGILDSAGIPVAIHGFLDGRDTPPSSGAEYFENLIADIADLSRTSIATLSGRYYAMDRDTRWDRVELAYAMLTEGRGARGDDPLAAIKASYADQVTDEFMLPTAIGSYDGMKQGDGILMANFRADRAREILTALLDPAFDGFERNAAIAFAGACGMVEYSLDLNRHLSVMFAPIPLTGIIGAVVSEAGLKQLRIAETEKYAHVTFFFNGGVEAPFGGEERILIPSPKVATYDECPEMSAAEVTDRLVEAIHGGRFDFILVNYANPDMVGHTGDMAAAVKAIATIDCCLGRLEQAAIETGGALLVSADHGNAETMRNPETGEPFTSHTLNDVPVLLVNAPPWVGALGNGRLADVAPTLLALMGLERPEQMTGSSLLKPASSRSDDARERIPA
ncbi:MAG: 2,3-bisphosphoglycerate-independent phosphoglycerate mutase [Alphaproteobacteria bacterium]